jgi:hypothetical protein
MKHTILLLALLGVLTTSMFAQARVTGPSWDGYVKRGKVNVRAGGSIWSANGISVAHTQEIYDSREAALYILSRFKGKMRLASEIEPNAPAMHFKVTMRKANARIAWVCGNDLHYIESKSYAEATEFLKSWSFQKECS